MRSSEKTTEDSHIEDILYHQCVNLPSSFLKNARNKDDFNTYNIYWEENDILDYDSDIDRDEKYDLH